MTNNRLGLEQQALDEVAKELTEFNTFFPKYESSARDCATVLLNTYFNAIERLEKEAATPMPTIGATYRHYFSQVLFKVISTKIVVPGVSWSDFILLQALEVENPKVEYILVSHADWCERLESSHTKYEIKSRPKFILVEKEQA